MVMRHTGDEPREWLEGAWSSRTYYVQDPSDEERFLFVKADHPGAAPLTVVSP